MAGAQKLVGKVAIVTGGASGIGEVTARLFADHGARGVVIADVQDEKGRSVAELIGSHRCSFFHCDISDEDQVKSMVEFAVETYGGLDVVFSNAGVVSIPTQSVFDLDLSIFDDIMRVNARGSATVVKHVARKMAEIGTRNGAIVCTASTATVVGAPANVDYTMSKHAIVGLVQAAFPSLGAAGIRINCVSPGVVLTPLAARIGLADAEIVEKAVGPVTSVKGVALTAEHVAEAVLYLCSDAAAFVTGQNLVLDGGISVHPLVQAMMKSAS